MQELIKRGCRLDVYKKELTACIIGEGIGKEIRTYATITNDSVRLKEWLKEKGITHVAMESTGACI